MIRPELKAAAIRWREALVGAVVVALGLWWVATAWGLVFWAGILVVIAGIALIVAGVQRGRFRVGTGGQGVVEVTEGRVRYFGPFNGGTVALSEMTRLSIDPRANPGCWVLSQYGQPDLRIPLNAEGSDALFDIFAALPAIRTGMLVAEVQKSVGRQSAVPVVIWERSRLRLH